MTTVLERGGQVRPAVARPEPSATPVAAPPAPAAGLPAWPVLALLWGFPIWWACGLTVIMGGLLSVVMVSYLILGRSLRVVPGTLALVAFLVWVVPTGIMIDSGARLVGFGYRFTILVVAVTAFVYTVNAGARLTRRRVVDALTFVWFFTILGGIAGMLVPEVRLTTPVGMLLPTGIRGNEYVQDLFFPPMAEIQHPWGAPAPLVRPSAPFPYANSWGVAIVLLTPVAIACFMLHRRMIVRLAILGGFVAMVAPAVATGNRAMFGALAVALVYLVGRLALRNRALPVLALGAVGIASIAAVIAGGLFQSFAHRQSYGSSTDYRLSLYVETIQRTLQSPLLGWGAPRPSTDLSVSVGTQGFIWTLMFSYGFVGLALFLVFAIGAFLRTLRATDDVDVVLHGTLLAGLTVIIVYGLDIMQLVTFMLVAAVLLRRRYGLEPTT